MERLIVCVEGTHGVGKSTIIQQLTHQIRDYELSIHAVKDSNHPSVQKARKNIRNGLDAKEALYQIIQARKDFWNDQPKEGIILLDRHYYTSAVLMQTNYFSAKKIIYEHIKAGIPIPNYTVILDAPTNTLITRLANRKKEGDKYIQLNQLEKEKERYQEIADNYVECNIITTQNKTTKIIATNIKKELEALL